MTLMYVLSLALPVAGGFVVGRWYERAHRRRNR